MGVVIERWRAVVGSEGQYEVSDLGNVRSMDRIVVTRTGVARRLRGKLIRPLRNPSGHLMFGMHVKRTSRFMYIHAVVLEAFVSSAPPGTEACHNDGDPNNNSLNNLRWDTRARNVTDIKYHGGRKTTKLWPDDVRAIRGLLGQLPQKEIANMFGVHRSMVSHIKCGTAHTDV